MPYTQHAIHTNEPIIQDAELRELLTKGNLFEWLKPLLQSNVTETNTPQRPRQEFEQKTLSPSQKKWMKLSEKMVELSALIEKTRIKR